jgi:signal transduction histidine kinase
MLWGAAMSQRARAMRKHLRVLTLLSGIILLENGARMFAAGSLDSPADTPPGHFVTNATQFKTLSPSDYLDGCNFQLEGTVTLIDTNRNLMVLQDETGSVALNFRPMEREFHFGQRVALDGTNCVPYFARFPAFPFQPSGRELRGSFEAPTGCGDYYLARMRGYLHPPTTGEYSFWIASDNSSELWLSADRSPSNARKIAFIPRFNWVAPREWSHLPSQHSQSIRLEAGKTYYIEALHEQTTVGDNLAVAWQGPGLEQSVIEGRYLTPREGLKELTTNGILREFWTNYISGDLTDLGGGRPFQLGLSVESVGVHFGGEGQLPKPSPIAAGQAWRAGDNYRWVTIEGTAKFTGTAENAVWIELAGEQAQVQVRAPRLDAPFLQRLRNARIRIEGVCEGAYGKGENLEPGVIWVSRESDIHIIEGGNTNVTTAALESSESTSMSTTTPTMQGFYSTRGVVTFNDRVMGSNYLVVQEDESAMLVSGGETQSYQYQLKVGDWVELGGALQPGKYLAALSPLVVTELGPHALPVPITERLGTSTLGNQRGKWSEFEGVVHSVNSNSTISVIGKNGLVYFWIGQIGASDLKHYVDAKLTARGVLLLNALDAPMLLVPSRNFVDVEETAPENPFETERSSIAEATPETESLFSHRVHVSGEVTYGDARSFFLQDASGGIRVQPADRPVVEVGDMVDVLAFPSANGSTRVLSEAIVRPGNEQLHIEPKNLDLSEAFSSKQNGALVLANAILLGQRTNELSQVLVLQEQQRVFAATLMTGNGNLPEMAPGCRVKVIGVCENETTALPVAGEILPRAQVVASLNILLRSPGDVAVLRGPPWWTWKRAALLVGTLLAVILGTLLWVHLLRRRLERQQAAQLAFSKQVLERLEDERRRIAANLHDGLGQVLLAIRNQALLAMQRSSEANGVKQRLEEISGATSQALDEVRQITQGLRPYQLNRLGLTQAIRATLSGVSSDNQILFASRVEDVDKIFDEDSEIHVYRIVQEAINNIIKHSKATEAAVVIKNRTHFISVSIRDNGRGFEVNSAAASQSNALGYGLSGIAERVRILSGTLTVDSHPGEGTTLTVEIPVVRKRETGNNHTDCR